LTKTNQDVLTQQKTDLENRINQEESYLNTLALDGAANQETINKQSAKIELIRKNLEETKELLSKVSKEDLPGQLEIYLTNKLAILKERNRLWQEVTAKNNRLLQLNQVLKGSEIIFVRQQQRINQLIIQLKKEQNKTGASKEYINHLKTDVKLLTDQSQELTTHLEELSNLAAESQKLRDQELQELKEKLTNLAQMNENLIKIDEQVYAILGQVSQQTGLLPRAQQVVAILNKPQREFGTQTDLTAAQIAQMATDLEKYQQDIQKEQEKVSQLQTKLTNLRQEIKDLQANAQAGNLNEVEQELLEKYVKVDFADY